MRLFRGAGGDRAQVSTAIEEARANTQAVTAVVHALAGATTLDTAARAAQDPVRDCVGWVYGS